MNLTMGQFHVLPVSYTVLYCYEMVLGLPLFEVLK